MNVRTTNVHSQVQDCLRLAEQLGPFGKLGAGSSPGLAPGSE